MYTLCYTILYYTQYLTLKAREQIEITTQAMSPEFQRLNHQHQQALTDLDNKYQTYERQINNDINTNMQDKLYTQIQISKEVYNNKILLLSQQHERDNADLKATENLKLDVYAYSVVIVYTDAFMYNSCYAMY